MVCTFEVWRRRRDTIITSPPSSILDGRIGGYLRQKVVQRLSIASRASTHFGGTNPPPLAYSLCVPQRVNKRSARSPLFISEPLRVKWGGKRKTWKEHSKIRDFGEFGDIKRLSLTPRRSMSRSETLHLDSVTLRDTPCYAPSSSETALRQLWDSSETALRQLWDSSEIALRQLHHIMMMKLQYAKRD